MTRIGPLKVFVLMVATVVLWLTMDLSKLPTVSAESGNDVIDSTPIKLDRLDPSVDQIVPTGANLERVAKGFTWLEGPVWVHESLYFADIPSNSIRKWTPGAGVSMFLQPSGYKGSAPYGGPEPGSNGMTLDVRGRLTVAGHAQRDVYRFESLNPNGPITVLADSHKGKKLNSPNDLVYKSDGSLYFTGIRSFTDFELRKTTILTSSSK